MENRIKNKEICRYQEDNRIMQCIFIKTKP